MPLHAAVTCPSCNGSDCRKSRWHSNAERNRFRGERPYRCRDCSHRFFVSEPPQRGARTPLYATLAIVAVFAAWIAALVAAPADAPEAAPAASAAAAPVPIDPYTVRAAQQGDPDAQLRVARTLLLDGVRDRKRSAEAIGWLQSAAEKEHTGAMVELGKLYRSGFGVLQDFELSAKWIRAAADHGDAEGMLELGRLYRDGVGVGRDPVRAYVWFNHAAAALHLEAVRERDDVARGFTPSQLREAQAQSGTVAKGPEVAAASALPAGPSDQPDQPDR